MPFRELADLAEAAEAVGDDFLRAQVAVTAALETGRPSPRDVAGLRSAMVGLQSEIRDVRSSLDYIDVSAEIEQPSGERLLAAWLWERQLRRSLVVAGAAAAQLAQQAFEVAAGVDRRVVTVRAGDTWPSLAQRELGDWSAWRRLLEANPGVGPADLAPGLQLVVPR